MQIILVSTSPSRENKQKFVYIHTSKRIIKFIHFAYLTKCAQQLIVLEYWNIQLAVPAAVKLSTKFVHH